jgi:hypothetical protein
VHCDKLRNRRREGLTCVKLAELGVLVWCITMSCALGVLCYKRVLGTMRQHGSVPKERIITNKDTVSTGSVEEQGASTVVCC